MSAAKCPECGSTRLLYARGKLTCTNCSHVIGALTNKYNAKKQEFNGKIYDSKFEANVAAELELRKKAGDILDYETQFKVEGWVYREDGQRAYKVSHKVDFRVKLLDDSYELLEAKGLITSDYQWRRKFLEYVWLPMHPDHTYKVQFQEKRRYK